MSGLGPFVLKIKKATDVRQWPVIAEDQQVQVQLKKRIVFVRCEAAIFEVLKTCVYLAMPYLLVVRGCFLAICIVKDLLQLF